MMYISVHFPQEMVSEELSSVETRKFNNRVKNKERFQKNLVVWKRL